MLITEFDIIMNLNEIHLIFWTDDIVQYCLALDGTFVTFNKQMYFKF